MAGCGSKKKYNGKEGSQVKKAIKDTKDFVGEKETDLPPPDNFKKSRTKQGAANQALIEAGMEIAGSKSPSKDKKAVKKKAGGKIGMGMTKNNYKKGGMVKKHRGDGCAKRGKTKGRMV